MDIETIGSLLLAIVSFAIAVGVALGLAFWANKAQTDRSAHVGIYLLFGIPGVLLVVAGSALSVNGLGEGPFVLAIGVALILPLIKGFRKLLGRFTPYDPDSAIDLTGLGILLMLIAFLGVTVVTTDGSQLDTDDSTTLALIGNMVITMATFVCLSYIAVGTNIWRSIPEATERLGLRIPDAKTIAIGAAFVVPVMVSNWIGGILTLVFQPGVSEELEKTLDSMTQGIQNPAGALLIGLTAGIGEELFFRGALVPRFGVVLPAIAFALMHQQYELSWVLLGMFGIGILLGIERQRFGTVAAIVTHAIMNILAVMIQVLVT
jgi:membrane protease YdiL (CAAX protease family)